MARIDQLAKKYDVHIKTPWQRTIAGAQRVITIIYDKDMERTLRARLDLFRIPTEQAGKHWDVVDVTDCFAEWCAADDCREDYFEDPSDLEMPLAAEFPEFVAGRIREALARQTDPAESVLAVIGCGALFGFARVSEILNLVEPDLKEGRLLVFFPGQLENNTYRLLDARDGWNYMAVPISLYEGGV